MQNLKKIDYWLIFKDSSKPQFLAIIIFQIQTFAIFFLNIHTPIANNGITTQGATWSERI